MTISGRTLSGRFFISCFSCFLHPCPWERLPRGASANSIRPSPDPHQKKQRPRPADASAPTRRRNACPAASALRVFVSPPLADARPHTLNMAGTIRSRRILPPPMPEVHAASLFCSLPPPTRVFQPTGPDRRPFSPHLPDLLPSSPSLPHCVEASRYAPFGTFPFHCFPLQRQISLSEESVAKNFSAESSHQNRSADHRRLFSKSPAAQAMSDVSGQSPPQKRTRNMEEYPRVKK